MACCRKHFKEKKDDDEFSPCSRWSSKSSMITARELFAGASGPDQDATGTLSIDTDPRAYVCGGSDINGNPLSLCEKYDPNTDTWTAIAPMPEARSGCAGTFVPDYSKTQLETLGYIYVAGGSDGVLDKTDSLFRYNIKQDLWEVMNPLPIPVFNSNLDYLDDIGGPLAQLLIAITGVDLPPCTDSQIIWLVGGKDTEMKTFFVFSNIQGEIVSEWFEGPDLPLFRTNPLVGRVFWRDAGITSFGVSNCASIVICGGRDGRGKIRRDVQLLIRDSRCNWKWIDTENNPSEIPNDILTLAIPMAQGDGGGNLWPETLATGGRLILFGGDPEIQNQGPTQFGQFRFFEGRYQRDPVLGSTKSRKSAWQITTSMPGFRTNFRALPLSQENSSEFGGNRVSRFLVIGGRTQDGVTSRSQLFQLPVPPPWIIIRGNRGDG
uniref:Galactose oxidase n=1 Tax=Pithovirus LCPAC401 TaxID=2506595 RepID=A0A481ZC71_9VIRU|nr:MAG: galactose oxidase [Pithovirus LCPAC401]